MEKINRKEQKEKDKTFFVTMNTTGEAWFKIIMYLPNYLKIYFVYSIFLKLTKIFKLLII